MTPARLASYIVLSLLALSAAAPLVRAVDSASWVTSIDWSRYSGMTGVQPSDTFGSGLVSILQNEARYELTTIPTWYSTSTQNGQAYYNVFAKAPGASKSNYDRYDYEQSVRPLSGFAFGTAALIATGTYSESAGGMLQTDAMKEVEMAIRGVAMTERANYPSGSTNPAVGIGGTPNGSSAKNTWEAAGWISQAAEAAYLVWDKLTPDTRTLVANMVIDEANAFSNYTVPYWADRSGTILSPGDTKAEEDAWNGHMLAVAEAMMPTNPNAGAWSLKASELQVGAYSRPSDLTNAAMVDGKQVQQWLNGYNTFDNGVLVNHNIIHPDYLVSAEGQYNSVAMLSLAHQLIPQSVPFNAEWTYHALTAVSFTPGTDTTYGTSKSIVGPGGTIYVGYAGGGYSANLYYPEGTDWTTKVTDGYINTDLMAEWLKLDAGKNFDSMGWAQARVNALQLLQNRPGHDGNIYQTGDWNTNYHGTDEVIYESNAQSWVMWWLMEHNQISPVADHWGAVPAPEPATITLVLTGGLVAALYRWRRTRRA